MKSKIKKYLKRCTIFLTIFTFVFSSCCFSSAALGDNSNGLYIDYFVKPYIEENTSSGWVPLSDYDSMSFTQSADGSIDKLIYSWTGLYGILKANTRYRLCFSFHISGPNWRQNSISFNGYFSSAKNRNHVDSPSDFVSLGSYLATTIVQPAPNITRSADVMRLGSRVGYNFSFSSFESIISDASSDVDSSHYSVWNSIVDIYFTTSEELTDIHFTLDNFSTDLFFNSPSDKEFTDYDNAEQAILDSTESGRSQAIALFRGFGTLGSSIATPLLAVGKLVGSFLDNIDVLNVLFRFSLSLGIFGFIVGMAVSVGGYFSSKSAKSERKNSKK